VPQQTPNYAEQGGARWVVEGELQFATGAKQVPNSGTQASAITDATAATGGDAPTEAEFNAVVTKLNSVLAALRGVGIVASS
jgi:hypothetical protein